MHTFLFVFGSLLGISKKLSFDSSGLKDKYVRKVLNYDELQSVLLSDEYDGIVVHKHDQSTSEFEDIIRQRSNIFDKCEELDNTIVTAKEETAIPAKLLFPDYLQEEDNIVDIINDMKQLIQIMSSTASESQTITSRLALMSGTRCPKWHEDYVDIRLIKSYYGLGTEWVNPGDPLIRSENLIRSRLDKDLIVRDSSKINKPNMNDVIVLSGKMRPKLRETAVPVLHRSPITDPSKKRLLFTVTLSQKKVKLGIRFKKNQSTVLIVNKVK